MRNRLTIYKSIFHIVYCSFVNGLRIPTATRKKGETGGRKSVTVYVRNGRKIKKKTPKIESILENEIRVNFLSLFNN